MSYIDGVEDMGRLILSILGITDADSLSRPAVGSFALRTLKRYVADHTIRVEKFTGDANHIVAQAECQICGFEWIAVIELDADDKAPERLECEKCGQMSGKWREIEKPEEKA